MSDTPVPYPLSVFATAWEAGLLAQESTSVLALRCAALAPPGRDAPEEVLRMVSEKPPAFAAAAAAALGAALSGRRAEDVVSAALRPLRAETRANLARLTARA